MVIFERSKELILFSYWLSEGNDFFFSSQHRCLMDAKNCRKNLSILSIYLIPIELNHMLEQATVKKGICVISFPF